MQSWGLTLGTTEAPLGKCKTLYWNPHVLLQQLAAEIPRLERAMW